MTETIIPSPLTAHGKVLNTSPETFGILRSSMEIAADANALHERLNEDGYLYLPSLLGEASMRTARQSLVRRLWESGAIDTDFAVDEAVAVKDKSAYFMPDLAIDNPELSSVLYDGAMIGFFETFFGEPVCHFDFTWIRAVSPGNSTAPHCDVVYMGRGTHDLLTAWTPFGDIPITMGGLIVLEDSHKKSDRLGDYLHQDVDTFCENGPNADKIRSGKMGWEHWDGSFGGWDGSITHDPAALRDLLGGRWLTADFKLGDVLIFTMRTIHASLDNRSDRLRLSSDTRYQPASLPIDERWVGEKPIGHGLAGKVGKIC